MKKILLLSLLVLFACSKDDANENKFRELQQGNWWIKNSSSYNTYYINFSNQYLLKNVNIYDNDEIYCNITPEGDFFEIEGYNGQDERWELNNTVLKENSNEYSFSIRGEDNQGDYFEEVHSFKLENNILTLIVGTRESKYSLSQGPPGAQGVCEINYFGF